MGRRVYTLRVPSEGFVYRYGRAESWGDPDMCVAWAPGNKAAAYALVDEHLTLEQLPDAQFQPIDGLKKSEMFKHPIFKQLTRIAKANSVLLGTYKNP